LKEFLSELTRRKVFKVGAAYIIVAWLAVQVASIAFPAFDAPAWVLRIFILVSLLGFPISLVFAWAFELTPDGLKTDTSSTGSKYVLVFIVALVLLAFAWYFKGQPTYRSDTDSELMVSKQTASEKSEQKTVVVASKNSIAVLPFANMSGKDEDYFSDGMTEELLNVLAKIPQLKVVARTSVFEFKDKGGDIRDIGQKLNVAHIIEGSIRRDGQQVRVTAQLVRVSDGFHVWSETYDRKLESVFALQDEIAQKIAEALTQSLDDKTTVVARTAIDPFAYDEYLKGRALLRQRQDIPSAITHFKAAVAKAPDFAAAWSSLSLAYEVSFWYTTYTSLSNQTGWLAGQAEAAERAEQLEPETATTLHALGNVARAQFKYALAENYYLRAMQIDPGYSDGLEDLSELYYQVGRVEDAMRTARQLVTLDPYFGVGWNRVLQPATALDRRADVVESVQNMRAISPNNYLGKFGMLSYAISYGRKDEALTAAADIKKQWPEYADYINVLLPWILGEPITNQQLLNKAINSQPAGEIGGYFVARNDFDGYNANIERIGAVPQEYYFADLYSSRSSGQALLADARVKPYLVKYGFVAYWREKGWPDICRPLGADDFECGMEKAR
jgi:TolB-like protein